MDKQCIIHCLSFLYNKEIPILISIDKNKEKELDYYPLSDLAREIDKSNQTIRYHLIANFEPGVDFKKENGKIYINKHIVLLIKEHYEKK